MPQAMPIMCPPINLLGWAAIELGMAKTMNELAPRAATMTAWVRVPIKNRIKVTTATATKLCMIYFLGAMVNDLSIMCIINTYH